MSYDTDLEQKLQEALAECERLRSENAELKTRLGAEVARETVKDNPPCDPHPAVNNHSSSEAKIALFRALF